MDLLNDISDWASSAWNRVINLPTEVKIAYESAVNEMNKLAEVQREVDGKIDSLPDGPEKQRLSQQRDSNRGVFQNEVIPAWNKVKDLLGETYSSPEAGAMGLVPLVPVAAGVALAAIGAWIYVTKRQTDLEEALLKDPALLQAKYGSSSSFTDSIKYGVMAVTALAGLYVISQFVGKKK